MADQLEFALDLMRRLPPSDVENNLCGLCDIAPHLLEDLLQTVDQPLKVAKDDKFAKREYLLCDYNRDGDSYRSPWSNEYDPPLSDGAVPPPKLRELEQQANSAFDIYRDMYFEGGVSSVYFWEIDGGFAGAILIKKNQDHAKGQPMRGTWDAIHVVSVTEKKPAIYKLTSTVMLTIETETEQTGKISLAGNLTREDSQTLAADKPQAHIINIGKMVEQMESKLRGTLDTIYFGKTKDVANDLRTIMSANLLKQQQMQFKNITSALGNRNQ